MKKFTLTATLLFCIFVSKKNYAQKIDFQIKYFSEIDGLYFRGDMEFPLSDKFSLCGGVSKDALQMIDISGKYYLFKNVQLELGIGYHKLNNVHLVYGFSTEFDTKKIHFDSYGRGYIDHKSLYATEGKIFYKFNPKDKGWIGGIWDFEYGKYVPLWAEVTAGPLLTEKLLLVGFIYEYHVSQKIQLNVFMLYGQQKIEDIKHPASKAGVGIKINLNPKVHPH